jgi:hypothetical protein
MNPATLNTSGSVGTTADTATGYLLSTNVKSNVPQQFNIPVSVQSGSDGTGRQGIKPDPTSPYLGVFNR